MWLLHYSTGGCRMIHEPRGTWSDVSSQFEEPCRPHLPNKHNPINRACHFGCSKGLSKSVHVLLNGIDVIIVLTWVILKFEP